MSISIELKIYRKRTDCNKPQNTKDNEQTIKRGRNEMLDEDMSEMVFLL